MRFLRKNMYTEICKALRIETCKIPLKREIGRILVLFFKVEKNQSRAGREIRKA